MFSFHNNEKERENMQRLQENLNVIIGKRYIGMLINSQADNMYNYRISSLPKKLGLVILICPPLLFIYNTNNSKKCASYSTYAL